MSFLQVRHLPLAGLAVSALIAVPLTAAAEDSNEAAVPWPTETVRIIVPYSPGGSADMITREVAQRLGTATGQAVIVENKPGGSGWAGSASVARAAPDGYTLQLATNGSHGLSQLFSDGSPFDPFTDFTPITPAVMMPMVVAVHPEVPAQDVAELIEWAKREKEPGEVMFGVPGIGSPHHLAGEALNAWADNRFSAAAYKGSGQSIIDVMGGHIPMVVASLAATLPHHREGRLRILGLVEDERAEAAPEIPTIGESVEGYVMPDTWMGFMGPAGIDPELTRAINEQLVATLQQPEVKQTVSNMGLQVITSTPEAFEARMHRDVEFFKTMIEEQDIQIQR